MRAVRGHALSIAPGPVVHAPTERDGFNAYRVLISPKSSAVFIALVKMAC
jgi:hypothetical protein